MQKFDLYNKAELELGAIGDESRYPVETYNAPKQVASAVSAMWKGQRLMTPIGGGVEIRPGMALDSSNLMSDDQGTLQQSYKANDLSTLQADQWWWD